MNVEPLSGDAAEWRAVTAAFADHSLIQQWEFGEAKARCGRWEVIRLILRENGVRGGVQCMVRRLPGFGGLVWINRGPLWRRRTDEVEVAEPEPVLRALHRYWAIDRRMYLRVAPPMEDRPAAREVMGNCGFSPIAGSEWVSARVDLSLSEERLRGGLKQKWRNCLNKAERLGMVCHCGTDDASLSLLIDDYRDLLDGKGFRTSVSPKLIVHLQKLLPQQQRAWVFHATLGAEHLGSIMVARYADHAEYLVGAVNGRGRQVNAGHFLLWQAVCTARTSGCRWFDLGGAHPQKSPPGIYRFKAGLNGIPYRLVGEWETAQGLVGRVTQLLVHWLAPGKEA